jgi:NAD(P)-dependent dehydrogenase (short-subunit alcohol dehydrogenase family)
MAGMQMNLSGRKVAVFGAARGIGRAIAGAFVAEGCEVHGFDRTIDVPPVAGSSPVIECDVTSFARVREVVAFLPVLDHVVYSVGVGSGKFGFPFWNLDPADWSRVLEVNLIGAVNVAHACVPKLIQSSEGSLLFLVSVAGQIGSQTDPPYSAAKAGLINFMQCAAKDLAPHGVRVNALSPGMVKTDLNESVWRASQAGLPADEVQSYETWAREKIVKIAPLGRWQEPEELAAMAVYLASIHARNLTGQTINIDGGQVMHA